MRVAIGCLCDREEEIEEASVRTPCAPSRVLLLLGDVEEASERAREVEEDNAPKKPFEPVAVRFLGLLITGLKCFGCGCCCGRGLGEA